MCRSRRALEGLGPVLLSPTDMLYSFVDAPGSIMAKVELDGHESEVDSEVERGVVVAGFAEHGFGARKAMSRILQTFYGSVLWCYVVVLFALIHSAGY